MTSSHPAVEVPDAFAAEVAGRPADTLDGRPVTGAVDGDTWLRALPGLVAELLHEWGLRPDGTPRHGRCALVVPVRRGPTRLALKVTWPHEEARYEHLALRTWQGQGAVRLVAADPSRWALLLERLDPDRDLGREPVLDACELVGRLHAALDRPAPPQVPTAAAWCARVAERLRERPPALPRRMVDQGLHLATALAEDGDRRLVHADLHHGNVLAGDREGAVDGWLAIDPKPVAGSPALAVAPLLHNRWDEALRAYDLRNHLRFRVDYACDPMGVDPAHARRWAILRELDDAWWASRRPDGAARVTRAVTVVKAMQG